VLECSSFHHRLLGRWDVAVLDVKPDSDRLLIVAVIHFEFELQVLNVI